MVKNKLMIVLIFLSITIGIAGYFTYTPPSLDLTVHGNVDIRDVNVGFRVFGRVQQMLFEEGHQVQKGMLLALLDDEPYVNKVLTAKAELQAANVLYHNAEKDYQRKQKLLARRFIAPQEYEDALARRDELVARLEAAKASLQESHTQLEDTKLYAPSAGTILTRVKERGAIVQAGETIYSIALDQAVWIRAYAKGEDLGRLHTGIKALIYTDVMPDKPYHGHIGFISPTAEFTPKNVETADQRPNLVYRLHIMIPNPDKTLRQGMPVRVMFPSLAGSN